MRNAVLIVLLLVLPGCYMARASESYYGIDAASAGRNVAFVLDISGSMEGKQEGSVQDQIEGAAARHGASVVGGAVGGRAGRAVSRQIGGEATKLGAAKRELIPFINGLSEDAKFTLLVFGREVTTWTPELTPASRTNKQIAIGYLRNLSADGGTPALRALEQAFRVEDVDVIFFISDGQPTDASADQILEQVRRLNVARRITIHTIGLGTDQDERFMSQLAQEHGGTYIRKK